MCDAYGDVVNKVPTVHPGSWVADDIEAADNCDVEDTPLWKDGDMRTCFRVYSEGPQLRFPYFSNLDHEKAYGISGLVFHGLHALQVVGDTGGQIVALRR